MVEGMSNFCVDFDFYEHLLYGNHNCVILSYGVMMEEGILQLVHNYVFRPVSLPYWENLCSMSNFRWLIKEYMDLFPLEEIWSLWKIQIV